MIKSNRICGLGFNLMYIRCSFKLFKHINIRDLKFIEGVAVAVWILFHMNIFEIFMSLTDYGWTFAFIG